MKQNIWNTWKAGARLLYRSFCCSIYIGLTWFIIYLSFRETYSKFLVLNGPDEKILEILNDELDHYYDDF